MPSYPRRGPEVAEEEAAELEAEAVIKVTDGWAPEAEVTSVFSGVGAAIAGTPLSHSSIGFEISTTHPAMGLL